MYLYLLLGLMCCVAFWQLACLDHNPQKRPTIWWYYLFISLIFFLGALRWERGGDWSAYLKYFEDPLPEEGFETGFRWLVQGIKFLIDDFSVYLCVGMFLILNLIGRAIVRFSPLPLLSLAVFFSASFAGVFFARQLIAVAICIFSLHYVVQRRIWPFLICVVIATLIHRAAFVFLSVYWVYKWYFSVKKIVLILGVLVVLSGLIGQVIVSSVGIFGSVIAAKLTVYLQAGEEGYAHGLDVSPVVLLIKGILSRSIVLLLVLIFLKDQRKNNPVINGLVNIYVLGVCLFAFVTPLGSVLVRAVIPFDAVAMFLIPAVVVQVRGTFLKLCVYWLVVFYLFFRLNSNIGYYKDLYIPYKSIFNKEIPVNIG